MPFEKRFEAWQADVEDKTLESYWDDEPYFSSFYDRYVAPAMCSENAVDPGINSSGALYWSMLQQSFNTFDPSMRYDPTSRTAGFAPYGWWDEKFSDEQKKYFGMAAFLDEREWDWVNYAKQLDEPVHPNNQGGPFNEYSYVPLGFYGYVAGPEGKPYYPDPIIFNYGAPSSERELPASRHSRPGPDPIATAVRYRMVRSGSI